MTKPHNPSPHPKSVRHEPRGDMESTYASGAVLLESRYAPARLPHGRVVDVVGDAWVRDPVTLQLRKLVVGDVIKSASVVLTDQNGIIQIEPRAPRAMVVPVQAEPAPRAPADPAPPPKVVPGSLSDAHRVDRIHESVSGNQYELDPVAVVPLGVEARRYAGGVGVAVNSVTVNEAAGTATFTVRLDHMAEGVVRVGYSTRDGVAVAGGDFEAVSGVLVFQPGEVSKTITVPIVNDNLFEGAEDFRILLSPAPGTWVNPLSTGIGTIMDDGTGSIPVGVVPDNDTPVVSIATGGVVNEASLFAEFRVTLSNPAKMPVTVSYASADGTAAAGADYEAVAGVITFAPGDLEHVIRIPILNDRVYEGAESFFVNLGEPVNALIGVPQALATIVDDGTGSVSPGVTPDDDTPAASINDITVNEAAGTATFTVTLTNAAKMPVMLDYASADGTAKDVLDYAAVSGTLTFAPGETTKTITVPILNDVVYERSEAFSINLSAPVHATVADGVGLGTIRDDGTGVGGVDNDTPRLAWRRMDDVNEGVGRAVFVLELSNPSDLPVSVHYAAQDGTALAGADYVGSSGVLTFAPGEMSKIVPIDITNDGVYEGREDFGLVLSNPVNAVIDRPDVMVGVLDDGGGVGPSPLIPGWLPDDDRPRISVGDVIVNEGAVMAEFRVTLSNPAAMPVTVRYATQDGTALAGADYLFTDGVLVVPAGVTEMVVRVPILNDAVYEGQESFRLVLSDPTNAVLAQPIGAGLIRDDGLGDPPPADLTPIGWIPDNDTPRVSVETSDVREDAGYSVFVVRIDRPSVEVIQIALALQDVEATQVADYGPDLSYSLDKGVTWVSGSILPFMPGVTEVMARTSIVSDGVSEFDERFIVQATVISGTTVNASVSGGVTIFDVTPIPEISATGVTVNEADQVAGFVVTLSAPSVRPVTVIYTTTDGTAASGPDYVGQTGTITFAPGEVSKTVGIPIVDDRVPELKEGFGLSLSAPVGAVLSNAAAVADIIDNDVPVVGVSVLNAVMNEGGGPVSFVISIDQPSPVSVFVDYTTVSGTATEGVDYMHRSGRVEILAGTTSATVMVSSEPDSGGPYEVYEGLEHFGFVISNPQNAALGVSSATGGIIDDGTGHVLPGDLPDDDTPIVTVLSGRFGESAGYATFQVGLNNSAVNPVVVDLALSGGVDASMTSAVGGGVDYGPLLEVSMDGGATWAVSNSVTFTLGVVTALVRTPIVDDLAVESLESFILTATQSPLSPTPLRLPGALAEAVILDNDAAPVAVDDVGTGLEDVIQTGNVLLNDVDPDGGPISVAGFSVGGVSYLPGAVATIAGVGDFTLRGDGSYTFTPVANYNGAVPPVRYDITDGANPASAVLILSVTPVNDRPVVGVSSANVSEEGGASREGVSPGNPDAVGAVDTTNSLRAIGVLPVSDVEGDSLSVTWSIAQPNVYQARSGGQALPLQWGSYDPALFNPASGALNNVITTGWGTAVSYGIGDLGGGKTLLLRNDDVPVMALQIDDAGNYQVWLSAFYGHIMHSDGLAEDILALGLGVDVSDGSQVASAVLTVNVEDDSPVVFPSLPVIVDAGSTVSNAITFAAGADQPNRITSLIVDGVTYTPILNIWGEITGVQTTSPGLAAFTTNTFSVATAAGGAISLNVLTRTYDYTAPASASANYVESIGYIVRDRDGDAAQGVLDFSVRTLPSVAISDVVANEGAGVATFTVTLSAASTSAVSVDYVTADGSAMAGVDYTAVSGTLTFAPGETAKTIAVSLINDAVFEGAETFVVNLGSPVNAVVADPQGVSTIMDNGAGMGGTDDDRPALAVNSLVVNEAVGTAYFTVTMAAASTVPVTVNYATADGTALAGADYTAVSGTLTFAPGETTKTIAVPILNDHVAEYSESFGVVLSSAVGGIISVPQGVGEIRDDGTGTGGTDNDFPVGPSVLVSEADGFATITVVRSNPWSTNDSNAIYPIGQTAVAGVDFDGSFGVVDFAYGEVARTFILPLIQDAAPEGVKSLTYDLFDNNTGAELSAAYERTVFIVDAPGPFDTTPKLFIESSYMAEPDAASGRVASGYMVFRAAMLSSGGVALPSPVTFNLSLGGGTATGGGVDYGSAGASNIQVSTDGGITWANSTSVTFPAGYLATPNAYDVLIRTAIVDDALFERQESFNLTATLSSGVSANSEFVAQGVVFDSDPVSLAPSAWIVGSDLGLSDQVLMGTAGNDVILGLGPSYASPSDRDTIDGGAGNDTIVGGVGNDVLTGGLGNDVFQWDASDYLAARFMAAPGDRYPVDVITDFSLAPGEDALDLRGLLSGEHLTAASLDEFLAFSSDGAGGTMIGISPEAGPVPEMRIQLQGVDLYAAYGFAAGAPDAHVIAELLARGKLIVDA